MGTIATIIGILLIIVLLVLSWLIAIVVGVLLVIFRFRHRIWKGFTWVYWGFRYIIKDLRYGRKRRKLKEQTDIYGEY